MRVYEVDVSGDTRLYGCLRSNGRQRFLDIRFFDEETYASGSYDHVTTAGRFVAWEATQVEEDCKSPCPDPDRDPVTTIIQVRDLLKAGPRRLQDADIAYRGRLVLTRGGSIAWTHGSGDEVAVVAFDRAGKHALDSGKIPPDSLQIKGTRASWLHDGTRHTKHLAPRF